MRIVTLAVVAGLLSGCITTPPQEAARPTLLPRDATYKDLVSLPPPRGKIYVAVYNIQDETGQFQPYPASNFSTSVPQSATAMLVSSLKDSRWFVPLERQGLNNLLNERKIIRAAQQNGTVGDNNASPLPSLYSANVIVEGSIIGYASNVKTGGFGARYFGIGGSTQYQLDQVAVNLRIVNVHTGEVLSSVNTSKTILSYEIQAGVFRFIDYQRLLEGEAGFTTNEPVMTCLMSAIEEGVIHLINDGINKKLWALSNAADIHSEVLTRYRKEAVEGLLMPDELTQAPPPQTVRPTVPAQSAQQNLPPPASTVAKSREREQFLMAYLAGCQLFTAGFLIPLFCA